MDIYSHSQLLKGSTYYSTTIVNMPTYEDVSKVASTIIKDADYQKIQNTITAHGRAKRVSFIRKSIKTAPFSLTITPEDVVFIHLGSRGNKLGEGVFKKVFEALRLKGNSVTKVAEARISGASNIKQAEMEDNLAKKFASDYIMKSSETVVQYMGKKNIKMRLMQNLMTKDCRKFIKEKPSLNKILMVMEEVALGLKHMHDAGYMLRDLKPENILLNENGHARLADLGFAAISPKFCPLSPFVKYNLVFDEVPFLGKIVDYLSIRPEKRAGTKNYFPEKNYDRNFVIWERQTCVTDLYALGVTIKEMLKDRTDLYVPQEITKLCVELSLQEPNKRPTIDETIEVIRNERKFFN